LRHGIAFMRFWHEEIGMKSLDASCLFAIFVRLTRFAKLSGDPDVY
jgi:hypothetical protein